MSVAGLVSDRVSKESIVRDVLLARLVVITFGRISPHEPPDKRVQVEKNT